MRGLLAACLLLLAAPASAETDKEAAVRAAFLYRLAFFVAWPEQRFRDQDSPIRLCLADGVGVRLRSELDAAARQRQVQQRPLRVLSYEAGVDCELLYVSGVAPPAEVADAATLIVVDSTDALRRFGQLALVRESTPGGEVRLVFRGHRERIGAAAFSLSSKLLSLVRFDGS